METKLHTCTQKLCPSNQIFINHDSNITRVPLLGKWPTEEKYKYSKPCNLGLEETLC
jgi:hypothetical protein